LHAKAKDRKTESGLEGVGEDALDNMINMTSSTMQMTRGQND
jgi:hypothetical protein